MAALQNVTRDYSNERGPRALDHTRRKALADCCRQRRFALGRQEAGSQLGGSIAECMPRNGCVSASSTAALRASNVELE
jgi:hypothetical protein